MAPSFSLFYMSIPPGENQITRRKPSKRECLHTKTFVWRIIVPLQLSSFFFSWAMLTSFSSTSSTTFCAKVNRKFQSSSVNSQSYRNITRKCLMFLELRPGSRNAQKLSADAAWPAGITACVLRNMMYDFQLKTNKSKLFKCSISLALFFCLFFSIPPWDTGSEVLVWNFNRKPIEIPRCCFVDIAWNRDIAILK